GLPRGPPCAGPRYAPGPLPVPKPLGDSRRPWRVAAGVSFPTDTLPFPRSRAARWSVVGSSSQAVAAPDLVTLAARPSRVGQSTPEPPEPAGGSLADRVAWASLALALLTVAMLRVLRLVL